MHGVSLLLLVALLCLSKTTYGQQEAAVLPSEVKETSAAFISFMDFEDAHQIADGALPSRVTQNAGR